MVGGPPSIAVEPLSESRSHEIDDLRPRFGGQPVEQAAGEGVKPEAETVIASVQGRRSLEGVGRLHFEAVGLEHRRVPGGARATADVTVAKFPGMVGMTAIADFAVDRDMMTRRGIRENVYRRLG